jgi:aminopeptidase YwaD
MKNRIIVTAVISICVGSVFGQQQDEKRIAELKKHLFTLASEETAGRAPGTKGSIKASDYIMNQFKKNKLDVTWGNGFQYFDMVNSVEPTKSNVLAISSYKPVFNKDFIVFPYSTSDTIGCSVVFAGYGFNLKNDSVEWNDYNTVDVKGKCVLVFRGDPDYDKPVSPFVNQGGERNKAILAKESGAKAILFVSPEKVEKNDDFVTFRSFQGDVGIPVIQIKRAVADSMLKLKNETVTHLEQQMHAGHSPVAFDVPLHIDLITGLAVKKAKTRNIIAVLPGSDAVLMNEYIVVGAHYDHLGRGGPGSSSMRPDTTAIHYGADDNASGVTAIMGIASKLVSEKTALKRSIIFLAFDAEEEGLLGSKYFLNNPLVPLDRIKTMLNFDMVGRLREDKTLQLHGTGTSEETDSLLKKLLQGYSFKASFDPQGTGPSDYAAFYNKNIPVIGFTTGVHPDYHTPADKPEKINFSGIKEIIDFSALLITEIANRPASLTFKQVSSPSESRGVRRGKVTLGIMPDFSGTSSNGVRVDGVSKGKPAEKAGILKDDVIVSINGEAIKDIYEYMFQMGKYNVGDSINVEVKRGEQLIKVSVQL